MNVEFDGIPAELRARDQWAVWKREGQKKMPYPVVDFPGRHASSTNPASWGSFATAVAVVEGRDADGLAYALTPDEGITLVDLDDAINGDGRLHPDAAAIVLELDTYTEWSQSGEGVHCILRGRLSGARRQGKAPWGGKFETWDRDRFVYLTGNIVRGAPIAIEDRQAQLDDIVSRFLPARTKPESTNGVATKPSDLDDQKLLERAFAARNGTDLQRLWHGDTTGYASRSEADLALVGGLAFYAGRDASRLDRLFRASGLMRDKWESARGEGTYGSATIERALDGRTEFYSGRAAAHAAVRVPPHEAQRSSDRGLDDIGNAARFVDEHRAALRYVPAWSRWLRWDDRRWTEDDTLDHLRRAKETVRALGREAADEPDEHRRKELLAHAKRSASEPRIRGMLALAAADPRIVVTPAELDGDGWLLNTTSGTVDLRTGELRPHRRDDLLTMLAGAAYDPDAEAPHWQAHLKRVLADRELIGFLQRLAGYSAIGAVREHVLPILHGPGANGKTATTVALQRALGEYAHYSTVDLIVSIGRSAGQATPEVADLRGRRLVTVAETPEDGRLAAERVKAITGGEPITARRLHSNPFTFDPSHTIWLCTNYKPRVPDDSGGIWRRLLLIPFSVVIPEDERDPTIGEKLALERTGILRWIIDGACAYLRDGLKPPTAVTAATADYRKGEDNFAAFLDDRTIAEPDASSGAAALLTSYNGWANQNGAPHLSTNALADKLYARGYERRRTKTGTRWFGLRLREEGTLDD
jgi:putative DNA primase/helicase